jgi:hypothetical protein
LGGVEPQVVNAASVIGLVYRVLSSLASEIKGFVGVKAMITDGKIEILLGHFFHGLFNLRTKLIIHHK